MTDSAEQQLIAAILADPSDDTPRAIFADWLEERDDPRAIAVRLGLERRALERDSMAIELNLRTTELDRQHRNWYADHGRACAARLPKIPAVKWGRFENGVVEHVEVKETAQFAKHAGAIFDAQPVHQLECSDEDLSPLLSSPEMARLGGLVFGGNYDGPAIAMALAKATHISQLRMLNLQFTSIGDEAAIALASAPHLNNLRELTLSRNELSDSALRAICQSSALDRLERLKIDWNEFTVDAAAILANSRFRLHALDISSVVLAGDGFEKLSASPTLEPATWLNLANCELPDVALAALFREGRSQQLERVRLWQNAAGPKTCDVLATNRLPNLRELHLDVAQKINARLAERLLAAEWLPRVEKLHVFAPNWQPLGPRLVTAQLDRVEQLELVFFCFNQTSGFDEAAIEALAQNRSAERLRELTLNAPISDAAARRLRKLPSFKKLRISPRYR